MLRRRFHPSSNCCYFSTHSLSPSTVILSSPSRPCSNTTKIIQNDNDESTLRKNNQQIASSSLKWKHVFAIVAVTGSTYYYATVLRPWRQLVSTIKKQRPPQRRTRLFVTGHEGNSVENVIQMSGSNRTLITIAAAWRLTILTSRLTWICFKALIYMTKLLMIGGGVPNKQSTSSSSSSSSHKHGPVASAVWKYIGEEIRSMFESMGGAFIKLGQWAATRPDLFTDEICLELEQLYNHAPPHDVESTLESLKRNGILDKFESVDPKPMNSGCIAQVHRAWLKPEAANADLDPVLTLIQRDEEQQQHSALMKEENISGGDARKNDQALAANSRSLASDKSIPVVVKVMHPGVMKTLVADVLCLSWGAFLIEKIITRTFYSGVRQSVEEFSALLLSQLDFIREAENLNQFRYNFRTSSSTVFPRPFLSITKPEILVESYEYGQPLSTLRDEQTKVGGMHESLATVAVSAFLQMLFRDNLVHADLHPGNLLARVRNKDGSLSLSKVADPKGKSELVILDPGLVTTLSARERTNFISLFACVATGDGDLGAKVMLDWMPNLSDCDDVSLYVQDMKNLFDDLCPKTLSLADFDISYIMHRILATMRDHKVRFDMNFATLLSSIALSESVGKVLQAKQNVFEISAPYLVEVLQSHELVFLIEKVYKRYLSEKWKVSVSDEDNNKM